MPHFPRNTSPTTPPTHYTPYTTPHSPHTTPHSPHTTPLTHDPDGQYLIEKEDKTSKPNTLA